MAVVTGASSGTGLEPARQFAEHGYDLVIAAENDELDGAAVALNAGVGTAGNVLPDTTMAVQHRRMSEAGTADQS